MGYGIAAARGIDNAQQGLRQRLFDKLKQEQLQQDMAIQLREQALREQDSAQRAELMKQAQADRATNQQGIADDRQDREAVTAFTMNPRGATIAPRIAGRMRNLGLPVTDVPGISSMAQGETGDVATEITPDSFQRGATQSDLATEAEADARRQSAIDAATQRTDDQQANIRLAASLRAPAAAKADDRQWVMRNGAPARVSEGDIQPGDTPYRAPLNTSETAQDRQRIGRLEAARGFLTRLNELRDKINTKVGPQAGLSGMVRQGAAAIGMDPDVAEYERVRAAGGRSLAVAIMGAQNLSDQDANAWSNMLPGARVDAITAKRLTDQIGRMLDPMGETGNVTPGGAPNSGNVSGGNVKMVAPDGRKLSVPADKVADLEAKGARRVQ